MYFPATPYGGCSIVDGLKTIGSESSYGYRERIAARNGIGGYVGSPAQNTHMLNLLKNGFRGFYNFEYIIIIALYITF